MRKLFNITLGVVLGLASYALVAFPTMAQDVAEDLPIDDDYTTTSYDDYDWEYDWDYDDWDYDWSTDTSESSLDLDEGLATILGGMTLLFGGVALIFGITVSLATYVYSSLALMTIANKLGNENGWFAWVPILNTILLFQLGDKNPWLLLIAFIPGIGALVIAILCIIIIMTICEKRGYDKLLGLLSLVPIANLVLIGVLAWGKKE